MAMAWNDEGFLATYIQYKNTEIEIVVLKKN